MLEVEIRHTFPEDPVVIGPAAGVPDGTRSPRLCPARVIGAPNIPRAVRRRGILRSEKPRMLRGCMIDHQIQYDLDPAFVGFLDEARKGLVGSVGLVDLAVIGGVVAVITGGREDRQKPDRRHTEIIGGFGLSVVEIIELTD